MVRSIDGEEKVLGDYVVGKKCIMIVNVASKWGITDAHYKALVNMYAEFRDQGLEILAFPCNQFMKQEPGTDEEIKEFAVGKYGVEFPMFSKIDVNGADAHEVYRYLRSNSELYDSASETAKPIPWNFAKFLLNPDGEVAGYFSPKQTVEQTYELARELLEA